MVRLSISQFKREEYKRKVIPAVSSFIWTYFFKDKSVSEITVCTCAIVHIPPKEAAVAVRIYTAFREYNLFVARRWIPVVISRFARRKVRIGVWNRAKRRSIPERMEKIII